MQDTNSPAVASGTNDSYTLHHRVLKFRAWDGENFYYVDLNSCNGFEFYTPQYLEVFWRLPKTQFTGLVDKNRYYIYEGDIVKITDPLTDCSTLKTVYFDDGCFVVKIDDDYTPCLCEFIDREVIGNIFENPEILERV